jgi:uncharacterized RDD family membrane protein YckC
MSDPHDPTPQYPGPPEPSEPPGAGYPPPPPPYVPAPPPPPPYGAQPGYAPLQPNAWAGVIPYASWLQRVGATLLDGLILFPFYAVAIVGLVMLGRVSDTGTATDPSTSTGLDALGVVGLLIMLVGYVSAVAFSIWNQIIRQGRTGWSIGKKWMGIRLIDEATGSPIGGWMNFARGLVHIVDGLACYIGYLWPLWDAKRQTFADKLMKTVVIQQAEPRV